MIRKIEISIFVREDGQATGYAFARLDPVPAEEVPSICGWLPDLDALIADLGKVKLLAQDRKTIDDILGLGRRGLRLVTEDEKPPV